MMRLFSHIFRLLFRLQWYSNKN